jgi:hypothetical protein
VLFGKWIASAYERQVACELPDIFSDGRRAPTLGV